MEVAERYTNLTNNYEWTLDESIFKGLWPLIIDNTVTDIDWDSDSLWVTYEDGKTEQMEIEGVDARFAEIFCEHVSRHENKPFNRENKIIYSDTDTLRITCAHNELCTSGTCFSIRKSLPGLRYTAAEAIRNGLCVEQVMHLLINCIEAKFNIAIGGEPGHGKTELAKFMSSFIKKEDKVITVEDAKEWHYSEINPGKRCLEFKVNSHHEYEEVLMAAVRLNPSWLMLSETRGREVKYIIDGWRTGVHGITTMHVPHVVDMPDRMVGMSGEVKDKEGMENLIYNYLDLGIQMRREVDPYGVFRRKIVELGFFYREGKENKCALIVENGEFHPERMPEIIKIKFMAKGVSDIFHNEHIKKELEINRRR